MKNKKLSIIGKGTVGCLAVAHFLRYTDWEINWVYDPAIPAAAVGEGTSLIFPKELIKLFNWQHDTLYKIQGTVKQGIYKENWGVGNKFLHPFPIDSVGMHLSAVSFQNEVFDSLTGHPRVQVSEQTVIDYDQLDSDFVMVCSGSQKELDNSYDKKIHIPVNAAYVTQCYWDYPKFTHSLTLARPWGWIFGIPLQKRCAIGYLYNKNITNLDVIKEDVKAIFHQYDLNPSNNTNHIHFNNYAKKNNFSERVAFNGNASFFLEPLEATSTGIAAYINRYAWDTWNNSISVTDANTWYNKEISDTESMICLHYMAGSTFDTEFWTHAKKIAEEKIELEFQEGSDFSTFAMNSLNVRNINDPSNRNVGSWPELSYHTNITQLGLGNKLLEFANKYLTKS